MDMLNSKVNDGQLDISCNVAISLVKGDTGERDTQFYHNRVTRNALMGIIHFIYGDFDVDSSVVHRKVASYTPKYLAFGGTPFGGEPYEPTTGVDVRRLNHEFENEERILIASRQITNPRSDYITISFRAYILSEVYKNVIIREAGLFTDKTGDNCWSKIALQRPINKTAHDYVDVLWEVKVRSIGAVDITENDIPDTQTFEVTRGVSNTWTYSPDLESLIGLPEGITPEFGVDEDSLNTLADYGLSVNVESDKVTITGQPTLPTSPTVTCYYKYETATVCNVLKLTLNGTVR